MSVGLWVKHDVLPPYAFQEFHPSAGSFPTSCLGPPLAIAVLEEVVLVTVVDSIVVFVEDVVVTVVELDVFGVVVELVEVAVVEVEGIHYSRTQPIGR